jgi:signal transduction histidine kinase
VFKRTDIATEVNLHAAFGAPVVADGETVAVLVFFLHEHRGSDRTLIRDVTDVAAHLGGLVARKQAEAKVRARNKQLETFADMISHDLRNPLTVILGRLDEVTPTEDGTEHIAAIERSATRMENMIADLLSFARSGQTVDSLQPVSLATVAQDSWQTVQLENTELDLRVPDTVTVEADPDRLMNVFENLFRNAREHNDPSVTVRVGLLAASGECEDRPAGFFVEDNGTGISVDDRDCIFDCGVTTNTDGTGLGLSIVREVVEAHGWQIDVTDGERGGARFEITGVETAAD